MNVQESSHRLSFESVCVNVHVHKEIKGFETKPVCFLFCALFFIYLFLFVHSISQHKSAMLPSIQFLLLNCLVKTEVSSALASNTTLFIRLL